MSIFIQYRGHIEGSCSWRRFSLQKGNYQGKQTIIFLFIWLKHISYTPKKYKRLKLYLSTNPLLTVVSTDSTSRLYSRSHNKQSKIFEQGGTVYKQQQIFFDLYDLSITNKLIKLKQVDEIKVISDRTTIPHSQNSA